MVQALRIVVSIGAPALLALAAPATAQYGAPPRQEIPNAGSSSPQSRPQAPVPPSSQAQVIAAAACLAGSDSATGNALLATAPYSTAERDQAIRVIRAAERCGRERLHLSTSALVMRGAVAEGLYESAFPQPAAPHDPVTLAAAWFQPAQATTREDSAGLAPSFALGVCTAAAAPDLVRAVLATEAGTDAEMSAITALNPIFSRCVDRGSSIQVDRTGIRAILAESLYRWSVVQRDGAASPWAAQPTTAAVAPSN